MHVRANHGGVLAGRPYGLDEADRQLAGAGINVGRCHTWLACLHGLLVPGALRTDIVLWHGVGEHMGTAGVYEIGVVEIAGLLGRQ
ncbi:hypothetical protein SDC9_207022 [bioreactor metagenome]|uniref:Uncharacterized protein n=1 Tax=bioreactor metagenome TaxID=1076179 RepID=A0A645J6Q5_9ZZZZ